MGRFSSEKINDIFVIEINIVIFTTQEVFMKNKMMLFALFATFGVMQAGTDSAPTVSAVNINFQDEDGKTALHRAVAARDLEKVKELLAQGANPNIMDNNDFSPFTYAVVRNRNEAIIRELLAHGASVDFVHKDTFFSLIVLNDYEGVLLLLNCGFDVDYQSDKYGLTALCVAAGYNNFKVVKELLARGANPNIQAKNGATALTFALIKNNSAVVRELLAYGADQSIREPFDYPLLVVSLGLARFLPFFELLKYKLWKKPINVSMIK